ncbi:MAG: M20/M25/M40 family metallo-hydrolase [Armatimonadetes bacterium]|nr:M20/M25/M40 family metallo-hydrolase [Armatimonadota bacterium]
MNENLHRVRTYLETHRDRHLARLQTLLRQPSVSVDGVGVVECAHLYARLSRDAGFPEVEVVKTPGIPSVWAAYDAGAPVTLAIYGMLDVRRADPQGWRVPPFSAEVVEVPPFPKVVMARGARAVKGPLGVFLNAVEACKAVLGRPPVNVLLLAEVDEIIGSPYYRMMIDRYRDRFATAHAAWTPGASQDAEGKAHLTLGYKGMIYMALRASGARWGRGPKDGPIHGMAKSVVDSPAWRLAHALSTLTGPDGNTVLLEGFDRDAPPPTKEEADEMEAIIRRFRGVPWQRALGGVQGAQVPAIGDMPEPEIYQRYFFGPSFNLNGLRSGYTGTGTLAFTLPHMAEAFFDLRIPRTWDVEEVLRALRARLDGQGFADVEIDVFAAHNGSRVKRDASVVRAAEAMFAARDLEVVYWPATGGGGPWSLFTEQFGMPLLRDVGLGHGRASARDEFLVVEGAGKVGGMVEMALSHVEFMMRMAERS